MKHIDDHIGTRLRAVIPIPTDRVPDGDGAISVLGIGEADVVAADAAAEQLAVRTGEIEAEGQRMRSLNLAEEDLGRALVVIVDDRAAHGEDQALIGPLVGELLEEAGFHVDAVVAVESDEVEIRNALNTAVIGGVDLVISVGGVGVGGRDVTPEATADLLDRKLPGIEEALRSSGLAAGAMDAGLSRGLAGVSGQTIVVNLANSRAAVRDGMATITPMAKHLISSISNF
ncbi:MULTISPECIES: MogA/MoaB family molybdenum cofactor biosynthesis protein [Williamsia]|uniref:Molybdenum cofactor synthesis domain-containing protein n=2 Tax=Williamsia marianensis TaxID=85044 RepID=A0A315SL65_WILMA|nr:MULTISPECIES: molybdopterin-binding protein [Williamsia]MCK0517831.1 molybdopterin-binding protein [Williamsia sp. DF01-3]PVY31620.1 molybdenum cofactor synthesis domain-containing protein [Williamsia marianensis]RKR96419.1 molybdenum cofactor synthesis domain-containing protein [Williamsia muralis]